MVGSGRVLLKKLSFRLQRLKNVRNAYEWPISVQTFKSWTFQTPRCQNRMPIKYLSVSTVSGLLQVVPTCVRNLWHH